MPNAKNAYLIQKTPYHFSRQSISKLKRMEKSFQTQHFACAANPIYRIICKPLLEKLFFQKIIINWQPRKIVEEKEPNSYTEVSDQNLLS